MNHSLRNRLSGLNRKWVCWITGLFLIYSVVGFFLLPVLIRWQALKILPALLKRDVAIRQVRVNPWTLSLTVRGLAVRELDGRKFVAWEEFYANFQTSSLFRWAWTFREIRLVDPFGEIILNEDGHPNFANLLSSDNANVQPEKNPGELPRIGIQFLVVTNGTFVFEDRTRRKPFRTEYFPLNFSLHDFKTTPNARSPNSFEAASDAGKRVAWTGELSVVPLRSAGILELEGAQLGRYEPYLEESAKAQLVDGKLDVHLEYQFESGTNGSDLIVSNGVIRLAQLRFEDPATQESPVAIENMVVDQLGMNLRGRTVHVGTVEVKGAALLARLNGEGELNLAALFRPEQSEAGPAPANQDPNSNPAEPWKVSMARMRLGGALTFEDLSRGTPFRTTLSSIEAGAENISTETNAEGAFHFTLKSEAAETLAGSGGLSVNPPASSGEVHLADLELKKYAPYYAQAFRGRITQGRLAMDVPYRFALFPAQLQAGISNLVLKIDDLEVLGAEGEDSAIRVPAFGVDGVDASLEEHRARVVSVHSRGGSIEVHRAKDGRMNLAELMGTGSTEPGAPKPADGATSPTWKVGIDEIRLDDYTIKVKDEALPRPAEFALDQVAFDLKGLGNTMTSPAEASVSYRFNESGTFTAHGPIMPQPFSAELDLAITNFDLSAFGPYVEAFGRLGVAGGRLDLDGHTRLHMAAEIPEFEFAGDVKVRDLKTTDLTVLEPLVEWDELSLAGIHLTNRPAAFDVQEVNWHGLAGHAIIDADGRLNLASLKAPVEADEGATRSIPAAPDASQPADAAESAAIRVGVLAFEDGELTFADRSITPEATISIRELSGTVRGLSSAPDATAEVDLSAKIDGQAPLSIQGRINPLSKDPVLDLSITNRDLQLSPFSPYMEKYGGYPLNRGRLSANLRYQIHQQQLSAENQFDIAQLSLGSHNKSPDATSLPIKLGIALLKDANGRIELDVPIKGRLDDPTFKIGPLIGKVVVNTIVKAATAPFNILGALVGGGEELSFVEFQPGGTNLVEGELQKLDKLAKALAQRPALNVDLEGDVSRLRDGPPLKLAKLRQQIRAHRLKELEVRGESMASAPDFVIDPADYSRILQLRFQQELPEPSTVTDAGDVPAAVAHGAQASEPMNAAEPKRGLIRRGLAWIGVGRGSPIAEADTPAGGESQSPLASGPSEEQMEAMLSEKLPLEDDDCLDLIRARTELVRDDLTGRGGVAADRLVLVAPRPAGPNGEGECRVDLLLN